MAKVNSSSIKDLIKKEIKILFFMQTECRLVSKGILVVLHFSVMGQEHLCVIRRSLVHRNCS